jgi:hypothetical protein
MVLALRRLMEHGSMVCRDLVSWEGNIHGVWKSTASDDLLRAVALGFINLRMEAGSGFPIATITAKGRSWVESQTPRPPQTWHAWTCGRCSYVNDWKTDPCHKCGRSKKETHPDLGRWSDEGEEAGGER